MQFIVLFGPPAVGKMAVGLEIEKASGLKLFHNHLTIELVLRYFDFSTPPFEQLVSSFRNQIFHEVSKSELPGLVFTYVWDLDSESDKAFVAQACSTFEAQNSEIALVELYASFEQRLVRNKTPDRLEAKPSKRDTERSEAHLLEIEDRHRMNTHGEKLPLPYRHLVIDNTHLSARDTADVILKELGMVAGGD